MDAPLSRRRFVGLAAATTGGLGLGIGRALGADAEAGLPARAEEAGRLIERQVRDGTVVAAALLVRQGTFEYARGYGKAGVDTAFLIASPTKPITVSAVALLRESRQLAYTDPVRKYLPEFTGGDRDTVTLRHLLNHTSGLPDMLPENVELRRRHAPLREFSARACTTPLLFRPGQKVGYQSMGILLAATIVEKVSGQTLPAFLAQHIFAPLRMNRSSLGLGGRRIADLAQCQVPEAERSDWDWNSPYWRNLGAPWGGAHSTVRDLAAFAEAFARPTSAPWLPATRNEMVQIQTGHHQPSYGLGWVRQRGAFGNDCSPATFGHFGSTGTVFWHDPASSTTCVLLTTRPAESSKASLLVPVSEIISRSERTRTP
jgi:CubicO group peptidase (beta-lactamase class C family)